MASFVAPIIGAAVLQYAGSTALWLGCLVVCLVAAGAHLLAGPSRERRAAQLRATELQAAEPPATVATDLRKAALTPALSLPRSS